MLFLTIILILIGIITLIITWHRYGTYQRVRRNDFQQSRGLKLYNHAILGLFGVYLLIELFTKVNEKMKLFLLACLFVLEAFAWWLRLREMCITNNKLKQKMI